MHTQLTVSQVSVHYGDTAAVRQVDFELAPGDIGCLLGPSGCGKTTLLRAIAGFEPLSGGTIHLQGRLLSEAGSSEVPEKRRVGMVFQDFALFPHLNVADNVGFALRSAQRQTRAERVAQLLELIDLPHCAQSFPHQLSGGQQQRVALARALAPEPQLILLDEPFSSLDSELRQQLAEEVRAMLKQQGITAILVTHDQQEAFAMADKVALLRAGEVQQCGSPYELYHQPANPFTARFIGGGTLLNTSVGQRGELQPGLGEVDIQTGNYRPGDQLQLLLRPDDIAISGKNGLPVTVTGQRFQGAHHLLELALADGQHIYCQTPSHTRVTTGEQINVRFDLRHQVVFKRDE